MEGQFVLISLILAKKSKMAAKIQDGGRKLWAQTTKNLGMGLRYHHAKFHTCCQTCNWSSHYSLYYFQLQDYQQCQEICKLRGDNIYGLSKQLAYIKKLFLISIKRQKIY